jgi:hypothetical protein
MKFTLTIDCGNAAFEDSNDVGEVARILRKLANKLEGMGAASDGEHRLYDINGNKVGVAEFV